MNARLDGQPTRLRPVAIRPRVRRDRLRLPENWPHPPDDRPRFAHHRMTEEFNGGMGVTFRTYADGHVVAYGRASDRDRDVARAAAEAEAEAEAATGEAPPATRPAPPVQVDDPNPDDWVVVVWTAHPLLVPDRAHLVRYLVDKASYVEALRVLDEWELKG